MTAATPGQAARCIWWSDPSDDFYGRCIHDASHSGPHLNEYGTGWYGQRWDHNTAQDARPAPEPLTAPRELAVRWREAGEHLASSDALWSSHFYDCAAELERALNTEGEPQPVPGVAAENTELRAILSRALATFSEPDQFGVCRAVASAHTLSRWGRDARLTETAATGRIEREAVVASRLRDLIRTAALGFDQDAADYSRMAESEDAAYPEVARQERMVAGVLRKAAGEFRSIAAGEM